MKRRSNLNIMLKLAKLVKPLAGFMIPAVGMGLAGHLCASFITILGATAVLKYLGLGIGCTATALFVIILVCAVLRGIFRYTEQACNHYIAFKLLALIRDKVFRALRRLCPAKLEGKDKGNLIAVITSDIELLEVFYAHTLSPAAIAFLFCVVMTVFIGSFHPLLGVIAAAAYVTTGVAIPILIAKAGGEDGIRFRTGAGDLSSFFLDSLRGLSETIQYGCGEKRLEEIMERTEKLSCEEARMKKLSGRNTAITNTVILVFDLVMLWASAILFGRGAVDFAGVLLPVVALMSSFGPCVALANLGSTLQNTLAAARRVLDILEEEPVTEDVTGKDAVTFSGASVSGVSFSYGKQTILSDVSMEIGKGEIIGISGQSGCGKSTLLKLLMRFWKVNQGEITISGTSLEEINTDNLRNMESLVTQETHLFHDSIRNNLRIAKQDATDEELTVACQKASVHDFIMSLPNGYDTKVSELGESLSGGERQRIGLARAFLHDADFVLLDEPTSNLDSLNEAVILKSLYEARGGKTIVLVSHRLSSLKIADRIYCAERNF